jgi:O-antigen/teichoic acid export membrane protein
LPALNAIPALEVLSQDEVANWSNWLTWVRKSFLSVVDQGLMSSSNFLIGVVLARWLAPEQFGAYVLAFSLFLLVSMLQQSLLLEPQRVFGPSVYQSKPREYLGILLWFQAVMGLVVFIILGLSAWMAHELGRSGPVPGALAGAALAAPCILLFWLTRGALYVRNAPEIAVRGSLLYCLLGVLGLLLVFRLGMLSPFTGFAIMGLDALVTSVVLLIQLRPVLKLPTNRLELKLAGEQHWRYGRWALSSSLISWVNGDAVYYLLLTPFAGVAAAGTLKALLNLASPVAQTCTGLSQLFLPHGVRTHAQNGWTGLSSFTLRITGLFAGVAVAYWVIIILLKQPVFLLLYGGKYLGAARLLPWIALGSIFGSALGGPSIALKALQSPDSIFKASAAACVVSLVVGIPATRFFGLSGVMLGLVLATLVPFVITVVLLYRRRENPARGLKRD